MKTNRCLLAAALLWLAFISICAGAEVLQPVLPCVLDSNETLDYAVEVDHDGWYVMALTYQIPGEGMQAARIAVDVNGQRANDGREFQLRALWQDESQEYRQDAYGNELLPHAVRVQNTDMRTVLSDSEYGTHYRFYFNKGENQLTVTSLQGALEIKSIEMIADTVLPTEAEYQTAFPQGSGASALVVIEGEHYTSKNRVGILAQKSRDANLSPADASANRVNALAGEQWASPLDAVTWTFTVETDGWYYIGVKYRQDTKQEYAAYKNVYIDGQQPVGTLENNAFPPTGTKNAILLLGEGMPFYLQAGEHALTLESTAAPFREVHALLKQTVADMNALALDVRLISGGKADAQRDWNLEIYLPDVKERLKGIADNAAQAAQMLTALSTEDAPGAAAKLQQVIDQIEHYVADRRGLDDLVNNIGAFAQQSGSLAESITTMLAEMLEQPVTIDQILVSGSPESFPQANVSWVRQAAFEVQKLWASITKEADVSNALREDALNVWMLGSAPQVEVLRSLCYEQYGEDVQVSIMSDEQKLLLAISAGEVPDVVIGASSLQPYRLAIRGALYDLTEFDDFWTVAEAYEPATLVPFVYEDGVYALPQTVNFWCLFYRTDYMKSLEIDVPQTWSDLIASLPAMYRRGLDVNTVIANFGALKPLLSTTPFVMQHGAALYSAQGDSVLFTEDAFVEAFTLMTDLYTRYGVAKSVGSFYNSFVNGSIAMGIGDISTYLLLSQPESGMSGMWDIALMPGIEAADGTVNRAFPSVASGTCIMKGTEMPERAWAFFSWWMSAETQLRYVQQLSSTYGEEYIYLTANTRALADSDLLPYQHQQLLLEQIANSQQTPCHPADALVERALSDAWNQVVIDGVDVRTALDQAELDANREIARKLKEFGYMDEQGNLLRPLTMASEETIITWKEDAQ